MIKKNKWTKVMGVVLSCVMLATTSPMIVLASEIGVELSSNTSEDGIIKNDETGIPDVNLYNCILQKADSNMDGKLTVEEASSITVLNADTKSISDIKGIEFCTKLVSLNMGANYIIDISALEKLVNLETLVLNNNKITDISALANLTNLSTLYLDNNQITDISPILDLISNHNLQEYSWKGNNISDSTTEAVIYEEEVEIRYLAEEDRERIIDILGLREYDGKVICLDKETAFNKLNPYGSFGIHYRYNIYRKSNGDLVLGMANDLVRYVSDEEKSLSGCYNQGNNSIVAYYEADNVWLVYRGEIADSGLKLKEKIEKCKVVEPFAQKTLDDNNNKNVESSFEIVYKGILSEQDYQSLNDVIGLKTEDVAVIPMEGSKFTIDLLNTSYKKEEIAAVIFSEFLFTRKEDGKLVGVEEGQEYHYFENGKYTHSGMYAPGEVISEDRERKFLVNAEYGTQMEDCEFFIPTFYENEENVKVISVGFYMLDGNWTDGVIVYNNEKTFDVLNFVELRDSEGEIIPPKPVIIEGWKQDGVGWWYQNADGTYPSNCWKMISGKWYAFDQKGYMRENWFNDGGNWYYLTPGSGAMATGWVKNGGAWYYMRSGGAMATGWVNDGGTWYYMKPSGEMTTGWVKDGGAWYYMRSGGAMATGWVNDGGAWYYMKSTGVMTTGWVNDGSAWYYMKPTGVMAIGWVKDGGAWYYMKSTGVMATGWIQDGGTWYYLNSSGAWVR